jgi:hypothetical protein
MIMPRNAHTDIGDSEYPGGEQTYCSKTARTSEKQGTLPDNFWSNVELNTAYGSGKYIQRERAVVMDIDVEYHL